MMMKHISGTVDHGLPFSDAVSAGGFLFISGIIGCKEDGTVVEGGVAAQTRQIMKDLKDLLAKAGATLEQIVKANVILTSADDFDAFNEVYASYFPDKKPARITWVSDLLAGADVEIDFTVFTGG